MEPLEIEVKFFLTNIEPVRNRIIELGAEQKGRVFETNIRYEDADKNLIKNKSLLRLRQDEKTTFTFKSEHKAENQEFKVHRELEVEVSDFKIMNQILETLGFHKEQIYEKWRETFLLDKTVLCIDTMPFGDFLEIEGTGSDIIDVAQKIGFCWEKRILSNYLALFETIKSKLQLSFTDVTFQNFKHVNLNPCDHFNHRVNSSHENTGKEK